MSVWQPAEEQETRGGAEPADTRHAASPGLNPEKVYPIGRDVDHVMGMAFNNDFIETGGFCFSFLLSLLG